MKRIGLVLFVGCCAFLGGEAAVNLVPRLQTAAHAQPQPQPVAPPPAPVAVDVMRLGERFEEVARKVSPAVVYVEAVKPARSSSGSSGKGGQTEESGSGALVRFEGQRGTFVLTNNHVISQAAPEQITVTLGDGRLFRPGKVWTDPESDIALLRLDGAEGLPTVALGDSDNVRVGQWVLAIGSPFGLNQTVTHGIISARERGQVGLGSTIRIKDFLQTDAAINPGSSGGPLVNVEAEVIGINTAIASQTGGNSGVAFSIPVNLVKRVVRQLLERGTVARGYLGVQTAASFEPADALRLGLDRVQGAWIETVYAETPAAAAGLRANDVILRLDNTPIRNENHLINMISALPPGQRVQLQVWRSRQTLTLDATIGDWARAQGRFRQSP
jgi:S1-C subfamily serine protease